MPREKPIIFNTENVRAILEGRKTQTRRVIKLPCAPNHLGQWEATYLGGDGTTKDSLGNIVPRIDGIWHTRTGKFIKCPYGQVGDRLWVRETWKEYNCTGLIAYKADGDLSTGFNWKPSIHMWRSHSRITLEITGIRIERLQDIIQSDSDMRAEGIPLITYDNNKTDWGEMAMKFKDLWDSLNAKRNYGWETNCWVWVISFKRSM